MLKRSFKIVCDRCGAEGPVAENEYDAVQLGCVEKPNIMKHYPRDGRGVWVQDLCYPCKCAVKGGTGGQATSGTPSRLHSEPPKEDFSQPADLWSSRQ